MARLDATWKPWLVARVTKPSAQARRLATPASLIEKWKTGRQPTAFQRCLAIHIFNTTESAKDVVPTEDGA
jgi:DNA-binding transcriptional regulator YdaS (Cro superfamily)